MISLASFLKDLKKNVIYDSSQKKLKKKFFQRKFFSAKKFFSDLGVLKHALQHM